MLLDAVNEACSGESKANLTEICETLPENGCYDGRDEEQHDDCGKDGFSCGDGMCIHGLQLCDHRDDCPNGADELAW